MAGRHAWVLRDLNFSLDSWHASSHGQRRTGTDPVHTASRKRRFASSGFRWRRLDSGCLPVSQFNRYLQQVNIRRVGRAMPGQLASGWLPAHVRHQKVSSENAWQRVLLKAGS